MSKITTEKLAAHGYVAFPATHQGSGCSGGYQKVIWSEDDSQRLYFINVYRWEVPFEMWSVTVQFHTENAVFNVDLIIDPDTTLADIEDFYGRTYAALGCVPDKNNN